MRQFFSSKFEPQLKSDEYVYVTAYIRSPGVLVALLSNGSMQVDIKRRSFLINKYQACEIVNCKLRKLLLEDASAFDVVTTLLNRLN